MLFSCKFFNAQELPPEDPLTTAFHRLNEKTHELLAGRKTIMVSTLDIECLAPGKRPCESCAVDLHDILLIEEAKDGFVIHMAYSENMYDLLSLYFHQQNQDVYITSYYSLARCINGYVMEDFITNDIEKKKTSKLTLTELLPFNVELSSIINNVSDSTYVFVRDYCAR